MGSSGRLYLAVALGAALGSVARVATSIGMSLLFGAGVGAATLTVNVLGSFLIGLYGALSEPGGRFRGSATIRAFVIGGFCGGFTTFSIFTLETLLLLQDRQWALAAGYALASAVLWLTGAWSGVRLGWCLNHTMSLGPPRRPRGRAADD